MLDAPFSDSPGLNLSKDTLHTACYDLCDVIKSNSSRYSLLPSSPHLMSITVVSGVALALIAVFFVTICLSRRTTQNQLLQLPEPNLPEKKFDFLSTSEFGGLFRKIKKINDTTHFRPSKEVEVFRLSKEHPGYHSVRWIITVGNATQESKIFVKKPYNVRARLRFPLAKSEQLAFLVSHRLDLHVVPTTLAVECCKKTIQKRFPAEFSKFLQNGFDDTCEGVVIQEGVPRSPEQLHMDETIPASSLSLSLDMDQIHRAIILNIILGKVDAARRNTVVDEHQRVMEIDNEEIGRGKTSTWMFIPFSHTVIDKKIINDILRYDVSVIEDIFSDMEYFDFPEEFMANIKGNFTRLHEFLLPRRDSEVKVSDLEESFYECRFFG